MADDVQVVADFNDYLIDEVQVGDFSLRGDELRSIEVPRKGLPAWKFSYDQGDGLKVMFAANVPIVFSGKKIEPLKVEGEEAEDE
jgi:hypothetical protein